MSVDRTFSFKSGEKSCTSSCAKYKWENTYHAWFMVMWWQQMKPQIVSVPMVVPACFLSCLCSTTTLDLWNYCKGNSGSPNVHTPRSASHTRVTRCQHLSDGFRRLESVEMWLSYRSLPSLLSLLFPRGPEHMYPAWFLGVLLVWRCLRHLFGGRAAGGPPTDVGRQSISRTFSVWLTWDAGFGEEGAEVKCHLMTSSWEDTLSARFISVSDDHGHVAEVSPGFIATCFSFLFFFLPVFCYFGVLHPGDFQIFPHPSTRDRIYSLGHSRQVLYCWATPPVPHWGIPARGSITESCLSPSLYDYR